MCWNATFPESLRLGIDNTCRENGIYADMPMQLTKYAVKVFELRRK